MTCPERGIPPSPSLGAALAAGATVPEALVVSNVAAGIVVGKFGTASVTGAELKKALEEKALKASSWHHRNNILTPEAAAELAERFRPGEEGGGVYKRLF